MRILIVDNNVQLCQVLEEYLNHQPDLKVVGLAHDGEQALTIIPETEPDLILLDITMPYLDGLGVLEQINDLKLKKRPKILVITAFGTDRLLNRLTALGADYFLSKPFRLHVLVERIRQFGRETCHVVTVNDPPWSGSASVDQKIARILHQMGVPPHLKGFSYLKDVIGLCVEQGYSGGGLSKEMYPVLAEKYKTSSGGVEAAIRNAVAAAWENGNQGFIQQLCAPYCEKRMPTNSLLIAKITEKVKQ